MVHKKIVLTGATGFLGTRTLEVLALLPNIEKITATGRTVKPGMKVESSKVDYQLGDLSDPEFVLKITEGADCIIHCAALSSPWGSTADFEKANLIPQLNLIKAAEKWGIKRFVFVSTPSVYFEFRDRFNVSESEPLPKKLVNDYAVTKREAEILLEATNLDYVILRPRALCGRLDTVIMPRMIRAFEEGRLKIVGNGKNLVDLTSVNNVVDAILLGMEAQGKALHQIYNITNGTPVPLWEIIGNVLSRLDLQLGKKKVPYWLAYRVAAWMEWKAKRSKTKAEPVLTKYSVGILAKNFTLDISKAKNLLGYTPKMTTDEALEEFIEWYRQHEER